MKVKITLTLDVDKDKWLESFRLYDKTDRAVSRDVQLYFGEICHEQLKRIGCEAE